MNKTELLQKIKALAENGLAGEKANAQKILTDLMKKYNINDTDLQDDVLQMFDFSFKTKLELRLCYQVFYAITGNCNGRTIYKYTHRLNKGAVKCTKAEFLEFEAKKKFYVHHFNSDLEIFYSAFIQRNSIFPNYRKFADIKVNSNFSEVDRKASRLASMLDKHQYALQIKE